MFFRMFRRHVPAVISDDDGVWLPHVVEWDCGAGAAGDALLLTFIVAEVV
jgi:hypothetical protein